MLGVGEQAFEIGSARLAGVDLHDVGAAVAARNLDDAEPVPPDNEPQRLRVDRRRLAKRRIGRQIVAVEANHRRGMPDLVQIQEVKCRRRYR